MHSVYGETPFLTNGCLCPNNNRRCDCCSPGSAAGLSGAMLRGTIWNRYVETRNPSQFIELASGSGPFSGLDWQSCVLLPTSY